MKRSVPKFASVYNILHQQIAGGHYKPGDLLPSEPELERLFNISRTTVRKVISLLIQDQLVQPRQGFGTIILNVKTAQRLNKVTSFTETLQNKGYDVTTRDITIERIIPPSQVAVELGIHDNTTVVRIQRVRLVNGRPVAIMINYLVEDLVPFIENDIQEMNSLYKLLEDKYNVVITTAKEYIGARAAGFLEAETLQISEGAPLLFTKRTTYSQESPIEYVVTSIVADIYEYMIYSHGRE